MEGSAETYQSTYRLGACYTLITKSFLIDKAPPSFFYPANLPPSLIIKISGRGLDMVSPNPNIGQEPIETQRKKKRNPSLHRPLKRKSITNTKKIYHQANENQKNTSNLESSLGLNIPTSVDKTVILVIQRCHGYPHQGHWDFPTGVISVLPVILDQAIRCSHRLSMHLPNPQRRICGELSRSVPVGKVALLLWLLLLLHL